MVEEEDEKEEGVVGDEEEDGKEDKDVFKDYNYAGLKKKKKLLV